jgi:hypothetical protein
MSMRPYSVDLRVLRGATRADLAQALRIVAEDIERGESAKRYEGRAAIVEFRVHGPNPLPAISWKAQK